MTVRINLKRGYIIKIELTIKAADWAFSFKNIHTKEKQKKHSRQWREKNVHGIPEIIKVSCKAEKTIPNIWYGKGDAAKWEAMHTEVTN